MVFADSKVTAEKCMARPRKRTGNEAWSLGFTTSWLYDRKQASYTSQELIYSHGSLGALPSSHGNR